MGLSSAILGKDLYDLTLKDLQNFFETPQEETSVLEFKSGDIELQKIHREVAAFLNTEGGILIIGAPREDLQNNRVCRGDLIACKNIHGQEALLHSIGANITPSPSGIRAKTIEYASGKVFVLEITQSYTPPHQVNTEGKYYIRLEREAKPAPHGIVEALFNRRQRPKLTSNVRFFKINQQRIRFLITLNNNSEIHAEGISFIFDLSGVKSVDRYSNLYHDQVKTPRDDKMHFQDEIPGILVKGLEINLEFDITLRMGFVFYKLSYYAKNSKLETVECLFDASAKTTLIYYDNNEINSSFNAGDAKRKFLQLQQDSLRNVLVKNQIGGEMRDNETLTQRFFGQCLARGMKLPGSYLEFLSIFNGFKGISNNREINFWAVETLELSLLKNADVSSEIIIGDHAGEPIVISFENVEQPEFVWPIFDQLGELELKNASSFYEIIEDLFSGFSS